MTQRQVLCLNMWIACLHELTPPRMPHKVRFVSGYDDGRSYVLCVVLGPERDDDEEREMFGGIAYADGEQRAPGPVFEETRAEMLSLFD